MFNVATMDTRFTVSKYNTHTNTAAIVLVFTNLTNADKISLLLPLVQLC